jgi:restriction system protein
VCEKVAEILQVPNVAFDDLNKSGVSRFENDVAWARAYLVAAEYIDKTRRGVWTLTEKGRHAVTLSGDEVQELVRQVQRQRSGSSEEATTSGEPGNDQATNDVVVVRSYRDRLLGLLSALPPSGFERLCQRLLRESGFQDVSVTGRSGDGGIDGIGTLQVNAFVSFKVLFQCKRWKGAVGPAQVRDFRGAMMGRADKGVIITTGAFSADAHREAVRDGVPPIELIDGESLVDLLEQLELGLVPRTTFDVDFAFFEEFQEDVKVNASNPRRKGSAAVGDGT